MKRQRMTLKGLSPHVQGRAWEGDHHLRIGRMTAFEVSIDDSSVSRQHAEVVLGQEGWEVRDLGSTNGTFLNGARLSRSGSALRDGDILQCGSLLFAVTLAADAGRPDRGSGEADWLVEHQLHQSWDDVVQFLVRQPPRTDRAAAFLRRVLQFGRETFDGTTVDSYLASILWEAAEVLQASLGCVLLLHPNTNRLIVRATFSCGAPVPPEGWLESPLVRKVNTSGQSMLCLRVPTTSAAGQADSMHSFLGAALRTREGRLGLLCLGRTAAAGPFGVADLHLLDAMALSISGTIEHLERVREKECTTLVQMLTTLAQMVELRKGQLGRHSRRVTDYALLLAEQLQLAPQEFQALRTATSLLELGKIGLADALLQKTGPLAPAELAHLRSYVLQGTALLEGIPGLAALLPVIRNHNERWDGRGYPDQLAGEEIPLLARVVAVANAFDAMTTERPYAQCLTPEEAFAELERCSGTQFDPDCVRAFARCRPRIIQLLTERAGLGLTCTRDELKLAVGESGPEAATGRQPDTSDCLALPPGSGPKPAARSSK
jgi:pSer/pThr/pTyr-binding forkhead associated (FHA) protein